MSIKKHLMITLFKAVSSEYTFKYLCFIELRATDTAESQKSRIR